MKKLLPPLFLLLTVSCFAQDSIIPGKYYAQIQKKTQKVNDLIRKRSRQSLSWFLNREQRMKARLMKSDPAAAHRIFDKIPAIGAINHNYNSYLDTLQVVTKFLSSSKELQQRVKQLEASIGESEQVSAYLNQRQQVLKEQLSQYTAFSKDLQQLSKQAWYYKEQVREYTSIIQDRDKMEAKVMALLRKSTAFQNFFSKYSVLAGLLNINTTQSLEGLQTRSQVEQLVQQRLGDGPDARQAVAQQVNQARDQFKQLKDKFPFLDNAAEMPDFKPNPMKTKRFLQRIELGGNTQFQRANNWYPTIGDLALQAAYKFTDKTHAGIGLAYKLGMGSLNRMAFSSQGTGIRSFVDYRIKKAFSLNGGMEMNYYTAFSHIEQLKNWNGWQKSALMGIQYTYKVSPKLKGTLTVLYDFLARQQAPFSEPVKIRFGYSK
ncbi:hypothetical protein SAMN05428988_4304 [Chitinophaga sp. YR573]|uniref:hypothetical protein n=1 Tax=Chitinophaga sp. YR573 TaxID=1881040 RepID=UPI0008B0DC5C|nr:hypothetical protein [Chitinophaga sp. YR573]SEW35270.1 hypothetical protein SAMN05428988_4304 [Chitinophaga sp. YR573]